MVTAKLVVVADEILDGRIQDSNSGYLSRRLHDLGVAVAEVAIAGMRSSRLSRPACRNMMS